MSRHACCLLAGVRSVCHGLHTIATPDLPVDPDLALSPLGAHLCPACLLLGSGQLTHCFVLCTLFSAVGVVKNTGSFITTPSSCGFWHRSQMRITISSLMFCLFCGVASTGFPLFLLYWVPSQSQRKQQGHPYGFKPREQRNTCAFSLMVKGGRESEKEEGGSHNRKWKKNG